MANTAAKKLPKDQPLARRTPRQSRALDKVELILEAAIRLIDRNGIASLTTNAVAETAGVSIGTLYQYFGNKQALLDALTQRQVKTLAARVKASLSGSPPQERGGRIRVLLQAVLASYGGRRRVHRQLMEHASTGGRGARMAPFYDEIVGQLAQEGITTTEGKVAMAPAQAFVLAHALAGVMRGLAAMDTGQPPRDEVEDALVRLVLGFVDGVSA